MFHLGKEKKKATQNLLFVFLFFNEFSTGEAFFNLHVCLEGRGKVLSLPEGFEYLIKAVENNKIKTKEKIIR